MATAVYPDNVRSFGADVVDFTTTILAEHVNYLRAEVNSVETVLGNLPLTSSGWVGSLDRTTTTWNTVRDRIANIEYGLNTAYSAKVPTGGSQYQVLQKNSSSDYDFSWVTFNGLPSQSGQTGKYLTTNGSSASWSTIAQYSAPTIGSTSITSGGTFTTLPGVTSVNGSTIPSSGTWYTAPTLGTTSISSGATVSNVAGLTINSTTIPTSKTLVATDSTAYVVPSQTGNSGKYLTTDGTTSSWGTVAASGGANEFVLMMMGA
jgi:hypothetical protein